MKKNTFIILSVFMLCYVISDAKIESPPASQVYAQAEQTSLVVGGQTVGIKLYSDGIVCVGFADLDGRCPAKDAGLKEGDVIYTVNGKDVVDNETLASAIAQNPDEIKVTYKRKDEMKDATIKPVIIEGNPKIGLWIRDSVAGVGTVTFYDKKSGKLASLGHAVTDADTGRKFDIRKGVITNCDILSIEKGSPGTAGEICGQFPDDETIVGVLEDNFDCGLFASMTSPEALIGEEIFPAKRDEVVPGAAYILSDIEGDVKAYEIEIERVAYSGAQSEHDMMIRITDEKLLSLTGGIVQGMSGCPIIQNGKLAGAVTHVFINEPERGYGIYIGKMLGQIK